jgi:hypothetical protein
MAVLKQMMEERADWVAKQKKHQARQRFRTAVECAVLLGVGIMMIVNYHLIFTGLAKFIGLFL